MRKKEYEGLERVCVCDKNKGGIQAFREDESSNKKKVLIRDLYVVKEDYDIIKSYCDKKKLPMSSALRHWFGQEAESIRRHNHLSSLFERAVNLSLSGEEDDVVK